MKEKLYTIPLMDAFKAEDECPFCFVEKQLEQHAMDFVLGAGASYMEDDVRAETDKMGFCRTHYKKQNMQRLTDDLEWFCDKFDYRNKDADWRTSKDALPRGMQKAAGGYPADEPYTMDK